MQLTLPLDISRKGLDLVVTPHDLTFVIGNIKVSSSSGEFGNDVVRILLNDVIIPRVSQQIEKQISEQVSDAWGNGTVAIPVLNPPVPLLINYTLSSDPIFTQEEMQFEFDGVFSFNHTDTSGCVTTDALPSAVMPNSDASLYLSETVLTCFLTSVRDQRMLHAAVAHYLANSPYQLDHRTCVSGCVAVAHELGLKLDVGMDMVPSLLVANEDELNVTAGIFITLSSWISEAYITMITFTLDMTAMVSPSVVHVAKNSSIHVNVSAVDAKLDYTVLSISSVSSLPYV